MSASVTISSPSVQVPTGLIDRSVVDHRRLANNEHVFPDVTFTVDEKNTVVGHYCVLHARLPQLFEDGPAIKKKKKKAKKGNAHTIELNKSEQITVEAMQRILVYAYCGLVDYRTFSPFKAIEVMKAATIFKIDRLNQMCQKYLQATLNIENIYKLLKFTDQMNVERGKQICMEFALGNADFFTSASAESLGFKLYQEVTALMLKAHQGQKANPVADIQVTAPDTIVEDFKQIYNDHASKDITFLIQGHEVKAHKALILDQSTELNTLINQSEDPHKTKVSGHVTLDDKYSSISPGAFESMLRLFYYSEEELGVLYACQLYGFATDFNLVKLSLRIEKVIDEAEFSVQTVLPLLGVAYNPLMNENPELQNKIKDQGMKYAVMNVDKIDFVPLQKMSAVIATQILQQVQLVLASNWQSILSSSSTTPRSMSVSSTSTSTSSSKRQLSVTPSLPSSRSDAALQTINDNTSVASVSVPNIPFFPSPPTDAPPPVTSPEESDDDTIKTTKSDPKLTASTTTREAKRSKSNKSKSKKENKKLIKQ